VRAATAASGKYCYRFVYEKGPAVRFLGHLDMMNVLLRAFLAARLPIAYSEGFRSHPLVAFGPPLQLSLWAENEMLDMTSAGRLKVDCAEVNRFLPDGLCVKRYFEVPLSHPSLNADIRAGRYRFVYSEASMGAGVNDALVGRRILGFLAQSDVPVIILKDKEKKVKNIRNLVYRAQVVSEAGHPAFEAVLSMEPNNTCRPSELLAALFPETPEASRWVVCRKECLHKAGKGTSLLAGE
jgi:radical SAM-linked protein